MLYSTESVLVKGLIIILETEEKQVGEDCGSCLAPELNYDCGTCADGLTCQSNPLLPDAPGTCVKSLIPTGIYKIHMRW